MLSVDRDAFLCDMAETYHIYDLKALPVETLAALAFGLRADSRIKKKIVNRNIVPTDALLAFMIDKLSILQYQLFAKEGDEKPALMIDYLYGDQPLEEKQHGYASGEEFLKEWKRMTEVTHG